MPTNQNKDKVINPPQRGRPKKRVYAHEVHAQKLKDEGETYELELAELMEGFKTDPVAFIYWAFDWGEGELKDKQPDRWQLDLLKYIGEQASENRKEGKKMPYDPIQTAIASGHGIGKSTIVAWLILWIMATRPHATGVVTANTSKQLTTKTWAELAKWWRLFMLKDMFVYNNSDGNNYLRHKDHPETWRCEGITCTKENSQSFAGLHAENSTPFYIFDEASQVPDEIWEVAEGGTTDGEPMWFVFGNPTRNSGRFRECFRHLAHRWKTWQIDSRTVGITNKRRLHKWVEDYGEDSDFVLVRVRGEFPKSTLKQFIDGEIVEKAFGRHIEEYQFGFAPSIFGIDPAYSGEDRTVVVHRKGLFSEIVLDLSKTTDYTVLAQQIKREAERLGVEYIYIDAMFGTGLKDILSMIGVQSTIVWFGAKSPEEACLNMRSAIWYRMMKWLTEGGSIPRHERLAQDLTSPETVSNEKGKIQLEKKEGMKDRGLPSPDYGDALALTFHGGINMPRKNKGGNISGSYEDGYNFNERNKANGAYSKPFN